MLAGMTDFWFTFAGGALFAAPVAWALGRWGAHGFAERLVAYVDGIIVDDRRRCDHGSDHRRGDAYRPEAR